MRTGLPILTLLPTTLATPHKISHSRLALLARYVPSCTVSVKLTEYFPRKESDLEADINVSLKDNNGAIITNL